MKGEVKSLTGVRGIAALLVVFIHYYHRSDVELSGGGWSIVHNVVSKGFLSVDLFFILSAFVMCLAYDKYFAESVDSSDYSRYLLKRIARIFPLYIFNVFLWAIFIYCRNGNLDPSQFFVNISLSNIFFDRPVSYSGVYWSLSAEFFLYLAFPFLYTWMRTSLKGLFFISMLGIAIYAYVIRHFPSFYFELNPVRLQSDKPVIGYGTNGLLRCAAGYFYGIACFRLVKSNLIGANVWSKLQYLLILLLIFAYVGKSTSFMMFSMLFSLLIVLLYSNVRISSFFSTSFMYWLGCISYSIYINHMLVLNVAESLLGRSVGVICLSFVLTILISHLTYKTLEIPLSKWLNKIITLKFANATTLR